MPVPVLYQQGLYGAFFVMFIGEHCYLATHTRFILRELYVERLSKPKSFFFASEKAETFQDAASFQ